jgi:HEAT repeat protein
VRKEAARSLDGFAATDVKETLYAVAQDANSKVRNEAIRGLGYFRTPDVASFLMKVADRDSSYVVLGSCLETLAIVDSLKGYDLARRYIEEDSYRDIVRRAALNVLGRMHDRRALPYAVKYSAPGNRESVRTMAIGILGTIGDSDTTARAYVMQLAGDGMPGVRRAAVRILGGWGGAATEDFLERRKHVEQDEGVLKAIDSALRRMDD